MKKHLEDDQINRKTELENMEEFKCERPVIYDIKAAVFEKVNKPKVEKPKEAVVRPNTERM